MLINEPRATIDFESRSAASIKRVGAWLYSKHITTEILCLAFVLPGDDTDNPSLFHAGYWQDYQYSEIRYTKQGKVAKGKLISKRYWVPAGMLPGSPRTLADLFAYIEAGGLVEAHNAFFEKCIWEHIAMNQPTVDPFGNVDYRRGLGAPRVKDHQWRCSAAKAATYAIPRDLASACRVMFPHQPRKQKDEEGSNVMKRICKPRPARKNEAPGIYFHEDTVSYLITFEYCKQDVTAEHHLSLELPDMPASELLVWFADQGANWRGVRIDTELCYAAVRLDLQIKAELNAELQGITKSVSNPEGLVGTQREQVRKWLEDQGLPLPDTQAATLDEALAGPAAAHVRPQVRRALYIVREVNKTSVAKFARMLEMLDPDDGRVRELLMFHAATTGRWAGRGIQVHNFPRGDLKAYGVTMAEACADVKCMTLAQLRFKYPSVPTLLSSIARGALIPSVGCEFMVADYAAIEARVVLWLAGEQAALDIFRNKGDLYCWLASLIFQREITKKDEKERRFGKEAILSLGFGVGFLTFILRARLSVDFTAKEIQQILGPDHAKYLDQVMRRLEPKIEHFLGDRRYEGSNPAETKARVEAAYRAARRGAATLKRKLSDAGLNESDMIPELALSLFVVGLYRTKFPRVVKLWEAQEQAALDAVSAPGTRFTAGFVTWEFRDRFLRCLLPSGREIKYADPYLEAIMTPWGENKLQVCYHGVHKVNPKLWVTFHLYGAKIVENITQAIARDILAHALVRVENSPLYTLIMTVHDELISEILAGTCDVKEFEKFMSLVDACHYGLPVAAEGGRVPRYQKL